MEHTAQCCRDRLCNSVVKNHALQFLLFPAQGSELAKLGKVLSARAVLRPG